MHDQQQYDLGVSEDRNHWQVTKAATQAGPEVEPPKQLLNNDQPREGGQVLIFEARLRQAVKQYILIHN